MELSSLAADGALRAALESVADDWLEIIGPRNDVVHARPATAEDGAQRLFRWAPGVGAEARSSPSTCSLTFPREHWRSAPDSLRYADSWVQLRRDRASGRPGRTRSQGSVREPACSASRSTAARSVSTRSRRFGLRTRRSTGAASGAEARKAAKCRKNASAAPRRTANGNRRFAGPRGWHGRNWVARVAFMGRMRPSSVVFPAALTDRPVSRAAR
ncbi:MAG: hypothetical protein QOE31_1151 [Solirubrobacteraceae bacterium]|nr:hypothetical protein [Solirubrobacteraceae bacterium]